jgi:hypothetical protein
MHRKYKPKEINPRLFIWYVDGVGIHKDPTVPWLLPKTIYDKLPSVVANRVKGDWRSAGYYDTEEEAMRDLQEALKPQPEPDVVLIQPFCISYLGIGQEIQQEVQMTERDKASDVRIKLQQLIRASFFSLGVMKSGGQYVVEIILREPAPYGMPDSIDGVPIVVKTMNQT